MRSKRDCYLIKTANWVKDLDPHNGGVTADLLGKCSPEGSVENNGERTIEGGWREQRDSVVKAVAHVGCFILSAGLEVSAYDGGR